MALIASSLRGIRVVSQRSHSPSTGKTAIIFHQLFATDRSRSECVQPISDALEIERRDSRRRIRVLVAHRKYQVIPLFDLATEEEKARFLHSGRHWRKRYDNEKRVASRELKISVVYQPTDEEPLMFGCIARRWTVRRRDEHDPLYGANWTEAITDAWYLDSRDVAARFKGFSADLVHHAFCYAKGGDEHAIIEHVGAQPSGLCAWSETKSFGCTALPDGEIRESTANSSCRIVSITEESFPASLFEPPTGFHKIPVYPNWFTRARLDFARVLKRSVRS